MKRRSLVLNAVLLLAVPVTCAFMLACGGSTYVPPIVPALPAIGATFVTTTPNPLVAQYTVTTALGCPGQVMVEFGPDTSYGRSTAWYPVPATSQKTSILVAGMRASTTYHMLLQAKCTVNTNTFTGNDLTFTTGPLPPVPFPALTVTRPNPSLSSTENPGIELINVIESTARAIQGYFTDRDANPIWYYDVGAGNYPFTMKLLPNGHMIFSISQTDAPSILREVDLAGNTIREMDVNTLGQKMEAIGADFIPAYYHHDLLPLANGHLIVLTDFTKNFTDLPGYPGTTAVTGDGLIDLDENWNPVWSWNGFDYLDVNRHLFGLPDWTHSNALVYSPDDGNLLLSMRHQSWVLKIDYNNGAGTGNILWKLGYQGDFALTQDGVPTADPSMWFSFQHFPSIVSQTGPETTLTIWDNGDFRLLDTAGDTCNDPGPNPCYSRATVFQVDESAMVANLAWSNLPGFYSEWGGSINQLGNGNIEYDINSPFGSPTLASEVQEVNQTSSPQVIWMLDFPLPFNAYRAYRVPSLYPGVAWQY